MNSGSDSFAVLSGAGIGLVLGIGISDDISVRREGRLLLRQWLREPIRK